MTTTHTAGSFVRALAAAGILWPNFARAKIVKLATAFLMFNWFAVLGLVEFLRNRTPHLWHSNGEGQSTTNEVQIK